MAEPRTPEAKSPETRRERARRRRRSALADKIVVGLVLAAAIGACLLYVDSLGIRNEKERAGRVVAAIVGPTVALFVLYGPITRRLGRRR